MLDRKIVRALIGALLLLVCGALGLKIRQDYLDAAADAATDAVCEGGLCPSVPTEAEGEAK